MEELIERTLPQPTFPDAEDTPPFYSPLPCDGDEPIIHTKCTKNINRLVLDLSIKDDSLHAPLEPETSISSRARLATPKTPTLTQTRQKAISLDSDHEQSISAASNEFNQNTLKPTNCSYLAKAKPHLLQNFLCVESNASASVPTTPKRQPIGKCALTKAMRASTKCGKAFASKQRADRALNAASGADHLQRRPDAEHAGSDGTCANADATDDRYDDEYADETDQMGSFETSVDDVDCDMISGSANSLISQYGTSSRANNIGSNNTGFRSNMSAMGLSLSNYSLSNFQGSHCSLTRSNYNIFGMASATPATATASSSLQTAHKSHSMFGYGSAASSSGNRFFHSSLHHQQQQQQKQPNQPDLLQSQQNHQRQHPQSGKMNKIHMSR